MFNLLPKDAAVQCAIMKPKGGKSKIEHTVRLMILLVVILTLIIIAITLILITIIMITIYIIVMTVIMTMMIQ